VVDGQTEQLWAAALDSFAENAGGFTVVSLTSFGSQLNKQSYTADRSDHLRRAEQLLYRRPHHPHHQETIHMKSPALLLVHLVRQETDR